VVGYCFIVVFYAGHILLLLLVMYRKPSSGEQYRVSATVYSSKLFLAYYISPELDLLFEMSLCGATKREVFFQVVATTPARIISPTSVPLSSFPQKPTSI